MEKVNLLENCILTLVDISLYKTYIKKQKKEDKTITLKFVKEWYDIYNEKTRYYGSKNSFVAPNANYEYQIDLFL